MKKAIHFLFNFLLDEKVFLKKIYLICNILCTKKMQRLKLVIVCKLSFCEIKLEDKYVTTPLLRVLYSY